MNKFERIIRYTCLIAAVLTVFYMLFSFYTSMLAREPQIVITLASDIVKVNL